MISNSFWLGKRVSVHNYVGTVRYHGPVYKSNGTTENCLGIEWDEQERGKHSGTFQGQFYFKTTVPNTGSFIPDRNVNIRFPQSFLTALNDKYTSAQPQDGNILFGANQKVEVETVGWEKIKNKQSNLHSLTVVGLSQYDIGPSQSETLDIKETCPNIIDLDLSRNLFTEWDQIADICTGLVSLESLRLSFNRLNPLSSDSSLINAFTHLQTLTLNSTRIDWVSLINVSKHMPVLEELHFGWNQVSELSGIDSTTLTSLKVLNLENNFISSWDQIYKLAFLSLEKLYLNDNPITNIQERRQGFDKLRVLNMQNTMLDTWKSIHYLNFFPELVEIRLKTVPILANEQDPHMTLIACLSKAKVLNGSLISPRRRLDAELYYLTKGYGCRGQDNFEDLFPRYQELVQIHGEPIIAPESVTSTILKDKLTVITIQYQDKTIEKKFVGNMKVRALRLLISKLFKLTSFQILWKQGPDIYLDDDFKDLNWYGLESGHELILELI